MTWQNRLLDWYAVHHREFPWRQTKDPYKIWLSEIIMQQTRTQQGLPYYEAFVAAFPTLKDLATAKEASVLKLWQGLGYYSRARNLHAASQYIYKELKGEFPNTFEGLLSLKGVGDYTASAIASIAYDLPHAVVDGNVYRVYARFFGIDLPINASRAFRFFKEKSQKVLPTSDPGTFNQAVMEFGALQCTPKNPNCLECPLAAACSAFQSGRVNQLPVKLKKGKITKRYFNYLVFETPSQKWYLQQRTQPGIWHKLFEFPLIEWEGSMEQASASFLEAIRRIEPTAQSPQKIYPPIVHKLSHQHIEINFWRLRANDLSFSSFTNDELASVAVPVPIAQFLEKSNELKNPYI